MCSGIVTVSTIVMNFIIILRATKVVFYCFLQRKKKLTLYVKDGELSANCQTTTVLSSEPLSTKRLFGLKVTHVMCPMCPLRVACRRWVDSCQTLTNPRAQPLAASCPSRETSKQLIGISSLCSACHQILN